MAKGPPAYAGHQSLVGVFGGEPDTVPEFYAQAAVNRFFRHDRNRTRPSIRQIRLTFATESDRIWFEGGNGQGAHFYNSYPVIGQPRLIASIAGKIFAISMIGGNTGRVSVIASGNDPRFMHAWFAQGFEWLAIQDGIQEPIFWDGVTSRRSDVTQSEMPPGSVMAFIHGRFIVASADGKNIIRVGEIVYANTNANRTDILKFPSVIPSFDIATNLGNVMGLQPMPFLDTGTATNELVALCQNGFTSFDFNRPEETFLTDPPIQRISLIGEGCVSSHGFSTLNGDVFYRRSDGVGSYRNARVEYSQSWSQTPLSRAVDHWLQPDRSDLLEFVPMISWQNMVFCGTSPLISPPNNPCAGYHRYCRGFVVFDAQSMSTTSRDGVPVWHGMWTGVRPWAFIEGRINTAQRCFAFSFDRDGKNRLYEITQENGDDVFGTEPRRIYSRYDTASMGSVEGRTSLFGLKKFTGGVLEANEILKESTFSVSYRPDGAPCWVPVISGVTGCDCPKFTCGVNSQPSFMRQHFPSVDDSTCVPGTEQPGNAFHHCQVRVEMEGSMKIERLNIRFDVEKESEVSACSGTNCAPIDCCPDAGEYDYHIAPAGTNTEIPDIECPDLPPPIFVSTRYFTAYCPDDPTRSAIGQGQGVSDISQSDADQKAMAAAQEAAQSQLQCDSCTPISAIEFSINGGTEDLSTFFDPGSFPSLIHQPWRLYDIIIEQTIATGIVDVTGSLEWVANNPDYVHGSFDPVTNVYTDAGGGSTTIALEVGCNKNGKFTWPPRDPYVPS
jgi:hypothetical protein